MYWTRLNQPDAESTCKADGGTLVTIKNAIDNRAVYNFAKDAGAGSIWIGLSCFGNSTSTCYWDDGSGTTASYSNFVTGPNVQNGLAACTTMYISYPSYEAKWVLNSCNYDKSPMMGLGPFICETPATVKPCPMCYCLNNYNQNCYVTSYQMQTGFVANATDAAKRCMMYGSLASVHSKMEIDYIRSLYKGKNTTYIFLGAQALMTDRFEWQDGSKWDFNYMDPLNFQKGKCLAMDVQGDGLWVQVDCNQKLEFICKNGFNMYPTTPPLGTTRKPSLDVEDKIANPEMLLDASNCNSTLFLAPGSISSFGYPDNSTLQTYCTWKLRALGPYRLGIYFDFWATYGALTIYDQNGKNIGQFFGTYNRTPFPRYTPYNMATVVFEPKPKTGSEIDKGFHAVVLPL